MRIPTASFVALALLLPVLPAQQPAASIDPPAGARRILKVAGKGVQIYTCAASPTAPKPQWTLKGPDARLYDSRGKVIGTHFAGPTWKLDDGSQVQGNRLANQPVKRSIDWLLLGAKPGSGQGGFANVAFIQRTKTRGGLPNKSACQTPSDLGKITQVAYRATYTFYAAP
jgi:hypothetical protein